jgi:hypothetical protein
MQINYLDQRKKDVMSRMKRVAALNNLVRDFCQEAGGTEMTFGEWLRQKNLQDAAYSNVEGLDELRSYDEALEDAVLDIGDAFDDLEEEYDQIESEQDHLGSFFGFEKHSNASGEKRKARQEARKKRREARKDFRSEKRKLKDLKKKGQLSDAQYRSMLNKAKAEKKKTIDEYGGNVLRQIWGAVKRFSPVTVTGRSGALAALSMNAFGWATAFAPALVTDSRFKPSSVTKAKAQWPKFREAWVKLGGDPEKLADAIRKGYKRKPLLASGRSSNFTGSDVYSNVDAATLTLITTGLTTLAAIVPKLIGKMDKDPYADGQAPVDFNTDFSQPEPEPDMPVYDAESGEFIDPKTGESINPKTGETVGEWKTYALYGAIGVGAAVLLYQIVKIIGRGR